MTGIPPGVPRRAGGHAADRLREQLEREYGIVVPEDRPEPADGPDPDSGIADPMTPKADPDDAGLRKGRPDDAGFPEGHPDDAGFREGHPDDAGSSEVDSDPGARPAPGQQQGH